MFLPNHPPLRPALPPPTPPQAAVVAVFASRAALPALLSIVRDGGAPTIGVVIEWCDARDVWSAERDPADPDDAGPFASAAPDLPAGLAPGEEEPAAGPGRGLVRPMAAAGEAEGCSAPPVPSPS